MFSAELLQTRRFCFRKGMITIFCSVTKRCVAPNITGYMNKKKRKEKRKKKERSEETEEEQRIRCERRAVTSATGSGRKSACRGSDEAPRA